MKLPALAVAGVLALGSPAAAVADPGPQPPEITPKSAAGSSPKLDPGHYRFTLPADDSSRYVQVSRKPGEHLSVAGFAVPEAATSEGDSLDFDLMLPDGETSCDSDMDSVQSYDVGEPMLPLVQTPDSGHNEDSATGDEECAKATDFVVKIERDDETDGDDHKPLPVELTVTREPKVSGNKDKPAAGKELEPSPVPVKDDENIKPGSTPATAAPLSGDTGTKVSITPGSGAYYKVRLDWNQRLDVSAQIPASGSGYTPPVDLGLTLNVLGPHGAVARAGGDNTASLYDTGSDDPQRLSAHTAPVRWANRELDSSDTSSSTGSVDADAASWASQPGWYVVYLRASSNIGSKLPKDPKPIPALLTVKASGEAAAGPNFTSGEHQLAAPAAGHLSGPGESSSVLGTALKIGLSVLVVIVAVAAVIWARRRPAG